MTALYRFKGTGVDFVTVGRLVKAEGAYVVIASARWEDALSLQLNAKTQTPVTIVVEVDGEAVALMPAHKIAAKDRAATRVELWAIVQLPDPFLAAVQG